MYFLPFKLIEKHKKHIKMKKLFIFAMFLSVMGAFAQEDLQGQIDLLRAELEQYPKSTRLNYSHG